MTTNIFDLDKVKVKLNHEIVISNTLTKILSVLTFIALTTFGAYIRIPLPFTPVPITLQTLFVMLSGIYLGANLAGVSQLIYIMLGCAGMPLFAGASYGFSVLSGVTGGYLIGFVLCGYIIGKLVRLKKDFRWVIFSISTGAFVILLVGTYWLKLVLAISFKKAFVMGFVPFIPGDTLKIIIVAYFYKIFGSRYRGF